MHGEKIDVTKVYNSAESDYNQFLRIAQETYWNTDKTHIYNEDFGLDFGEAGNAAVEHYEDLLAEIKQLHREGKEKELTEALKKFKKEIVAYGYAQNEGQDLAKAWTLKTVLPAANVFAQMHEVKDTYVVNLYDTQSNSTISKEVLTDVFAEPVMRDLILGYNSCVGDDGHVYVSAFDQVEWLNKNGLDGKRYKLNISDDINTNGSKADQLYNDGVTMLNEYNDRITDAKLENTVADSATTADSVKPIDDNSEYDTLTKGGYNVNDIISLMNVKLIELGKTPMNINVFTTKYAKFIQEYMNTIGMSIGADGKLVDKSEGVKRVVKTVAPQMKVTAVTHTYTESWTERETKKESVSENDSENVKAKEDAISNAKKTKVKDKDGKDKDTTYEDVYNNEFNKNGAVDKQKTGLDPTDSVKDDDELGKKVEKWAKEDAEANKKAHEEAGKDTKEVYKDKEGTHYISGGDEHKEEEYNNADTAAEEEARKYNEELQRRREAESQIQSQPEVQTQEETSTGGYSGSEVIDEDGFAPVVDEETVEEVNGPSLGR